MRNETGIVAIEPEGDLLAATTDSGEVLLARKIVLATGIAGSGAWHIPDFIEANLPRVRWGHTSDTIDFAAFAGKRVGVLGAGASAFDNATMALGSGRRARPALRRRRLLPRVNPIAGWNPPASSATSPTCRISCAGASCGTSSP